MITITVSTLVLLLIAIFIVLSILLFKTEEERKIKTIESIEDILNSKGFQPLEIYIINRHLSIAINKYYTKLALIENFNPKNPAYFNYEEIAVSFIKEIEKRGISIKIHYIKKAEDKILTLAPVNNKIKDFIHRVFKNACLKKIEKKFPDCDFSISSASDYCCSYVWAYSHQKGVFAYFKTKDKPVIYKLNLRKEHFTIDIKYNYFEAPVLGIAQQLFSYEKKFLTDLYSLLLDSIKEKTAIINNDTLFYDNYNNILYLSNGTSSLQSILLNKVEDVVYKDSRLTFSLYDEERVINFLANPQLVGEFEEFVINYNLKKIAQSFNYKTDKLINTTQNTKFIIDFSRDRTIYCANLNKLSKFSYLTIAFDNLDGATVERSGLKFFVRIFTKEEEIIDITCEKGEVAYYILSQLKNIIN